MVGVFRVDFDIVAVIGGLLEVVVGPVGDEVAGVLGVGFGRADGGVVGDRPVSVLRVLFLRVDLEIVGAASVLED